MPNKLVEQWLPPVVRRAANRALGADIIYRGPFRNWESASASTAGYDQSAILERVSRATRHVLEGSARFEQDGVELNGAPPPAHALEGLLIAAAFDDGRLSVLDFGGGLASHYLRWRPILGCLPEVRWAVVEQSNFVAEGKALFEGHSSVTFHEDMDDIGQRANAILASGVLQYLPDPHGCLRRLVALRSRVLVLDRIPYRNDDDEAEAVVTQLVPARMGKASYPLWVLSRKKVHATLSRDYLPLLEFSTQDHPLQTSGIHAMYRGSIWLLRA